MRRSFFVVASVLLAACNANFGNGGSITSSRKMHQAVHQSFDTSATPTISVENVAGDITVTGWNRPRVEINVDKYGENASDLSNSEIVMDHSPDAVNVKTEYAKGGPGTRRGGQVFYTLHVPKGAQVKLRNVSGGESIDGVSGKLDAQTVSGSITATGLTTDTNVQTTSGYITLTFDKAPRNGSIKAETVSGRISLTVPADISASVDAGSVSGGFSSDFPAVRAEKRDAGSKAAGTIGSGATTIKLDTVSGAIELRKK